MKWKKYLAGALTVAMAASLVACGNKGGDDTAPTPTTAPSNQDNENQGNQGNENQGNQGNENQGNENQGNGDGQNQGDDSQNEGSNQGSDNQQSFDGIPGGTIVRSPSIEGADDYGNSQYHAVDAGEIVVQKGAAGGGEVNYDIFAGTPGKDYTDEKVYTLNDYVSGITNLNLSPLSWETSDDSAYLDYIASSFYRFMLNSTGDGWSVSCEMVMGPAEDVTSDFVGQYGISAGDTAKAWKVVLRDDLCWDDGTPINADSYIYSYKELLDPIQLNRRADSLYSNSDFRIYGAKEYFYQGRVSYDSMIDAGYAAPDAIEKDADGNYSYNGKAIYMNANSSSAWSTNSLAAYHNAYPDMFVDENGTDIWNALVDGADGNGYVRVNDTVKAAMIAFIVNANEYGTVAAYEEKQPDYSKEEWQEFCFFQTTYPAGVDYDGNVGIVKTGDLELVYITVDPVIDANYTVPYSLPDYLVKEDLWESCKTYFNSNGDRVSADSDDINSITSTYGTTMNTIVSFGPYKLSYLEADKQITFERNENWFGYKDGKHYGQYMTDIISTQVIPEHNTALLAFLNGEIDGVSLDADDIKVYGSSEFLHYTPQSYTTKVTLSTDPGTLASRGTQVLANINFRKAFSLAIDRNTFASSYTAAASAGYGLLNYMYIYDPFTGAIYRESDGAKDALVTLCGLTYGEDGDYEDLDEAYDAITGYDLAEARRLMQVAYDQCVAQNLYDGSSNIEIEFRVYGNDEIYVQMFNYFDQAIKDACVGSGFEGKVSMKMTVDPDNNNTMKSGGTDAIFTTWGGAASRPYSMLAQVYVDAPTGDGNQMEYGFDGDQIPVTMTINGVNYTASLKKWSDYANSDPDAVITAADGTALAPFADYDGHSRAAIFSRLEYVYLSYYPTIPVYYRQSASIYSQKLNYGTDTYIDQVGFGGLEFITYNYDDTEWAAIRGSLSY